MNFGNEHPSAPHRRRRQRDLERVRDVLLNGHLVNEREWNDTISRLDSWMIRASVKMLRNWPNCADLADEVRQQLWVTLLETALKRCDHRPIHVYVARIHRNMCITLMKDLARRRTIPEDCEIADDRFDPFEDSRRAEWKHRVRDEISDMSPRLRSALEGQFYDQLSAKEAAQIDGVSERAINCVRFRARDDLKFRFRRYERDDW